MISRIYQTFKGKCLDLYIQSALNHKWGPKNIELTKGQAAVVCLFKNGSHYLGELINHHRSMGFEHIFLLDNGSLDSSEEIARKHSHVSYFTTKLSVSKYQYKILNNFVHKSVRNGWCLVVDIDEFFDFPHSDKLELTGLLNYLDENRYTATATQMLDLFNNEKIGQLNNDEPFLDRDKYCFYELKSIRKEKYHTSGLFTKTCKSTTISNPDIELLYGGIRKSLYGLDCLLTKHALFKVTPKSLPFSHIHFVDNANLADISCVLYHYKLTSQAMATSKQNMKGFETTKQGYANLIELIDSNPDMTISDYSIKITGTESLLESNFLITSDRYAEYTKRITSNLDDTSHKPK